jgi:prolipoprotein diacylglyceryl transferase
VISRNFARSIPSPSSSYLELGPITLHFYALCIIAGIAVAVWLGDKRLRAINPELKSVVADVAFFAVPSGIIGGRIYHVISAPSDYFGRGSNFLDAFAIWKGGLGIWGAISLGAVGAYFGYKRAKVSHPEIDFPSFPQLLDALAPGILLAQAIGRIGNWFNIELFGAPVQGWWALEVPLASRPRGYTEFETFHPTFAYEAIWCLLIAILLMTFTSRLQRGQTFALYIALYCGGRFFIEGVRIDSANEFFGLRQNEWVSVVIGLAALAIFVKLKKKSSKI